MTNFSSEEDPDEEEEPPLHILEMPTTLSITAGTSPSGNLSTNHNNNDLDNTGEADGFLRSQNALHRDETTQINVDQITMPWILQTLFQLNGLTLSLLMLPLMYIINTRVGVPVPYLPTYGAIAYLPYSFKPMYAYLVSNDTLPCCGARYNIKLPSRQNTLIGLLAINSICMVMYTIIPSGSVLGIFVVSFLRGIADSWTELCLGLTLIDHSRFMAYEHNNNMATANENVQILEQPTTTSSSTESFDATYGKIVSKLQSQAATCRNIGSLLADFITVLIFLRRYFTTSDDDSTQQQLSNGVANFLIVGTGILQMMGAGMAYLYRNDLKHNNPRGTTTHMESFSLLEQTDNMESQVDESVVDEISAEDIGLKDDDDSHPSYSSLEDNQEDVNSIESTGAINTINNSTQTGSWRANLVLVVILQLIVISFGMKEPISQCTSRLAWEVLIVSLCLALISVSVALFCNNSLQKVHRAGLFLLLRNAVPSEAMVVSSFFYTVFQSQPLILQSFSFLRSIVRAMSSWSYTRLWSRFNRGRSFLILLGGMAVISSLASLMNIAFFQKYQQAAKDETSFISNVLGIALLTVVLTTFFEEWGFLPELVLASVSIDQKANNANENYHDPSETTTGIQRSEKKDRSAIEYGSLISCIDFGDQLGALLASPLVAMLGITREDGFQNIGTLVLICSVMNIVVTIVLLPLIKDQNVNLN